VINPTRRAVLIGGAGAVAGLLGMADLVEQDVLPGRSRIYRLFGLNGGGAPFPSDLPPGELVSGSFRSAKRGGIQVGWTVAYPARTPTEARLPLLVALHGASGNHTTPFAHTGFDRYLSRAVANGLQPFAIASIDGGSTYWHPHPDGTDAGAMVVDEYLPLLADRGLRTDRLALYGWSMGGYGALRLAGMDLVAARAVAVSSPALSRNDDVYPHPGRVDDVDLRIDCGHGDPFYPVVHDFVESLDLEPAGSFGLGGHTQDYWRSVAPHQLDFVGRRLA
jgi:S-formylglutathione hydrolase FrmB